MDVVNRIVILLLSIAALVFGVIGLLLLGGVVTPEQVSPGGVLRDQWAFFPALSGAAATTAAIVCGALAVLGLIFLVLELLPRRREPQRYLVKSDELGQVTVTRKSINGLVQHEAATVQGVREVRPDVQDTPRGLRVLTRASLFPDVEAASTGQALQERIQQAIQRQFGLPVAEVQVMTQLEPFDGARSPRRVQ
jgi:hypothetical protein